MCPSYCSASLQHRSHKECSLCLQRCFGAVFSTFAMRFVVHLDTVYVLSGHACIGVVALLMLHLIHVPKLIHSPCPCSPVQPITI